MSTRGDIEKPPRRLRVRTRSVWLVLFTGLICSLATPPSFAAVADFGVEAGNEQRGNYDPFGVDDPWGYDPWDDDPWDNERPGLADPLEPLNRFFFRVNDRLYFWILDPTARGYAKVVPEDIRLCFRRFFRNLTAPARVVNHLLQGQIKASGSELARFVLNTTIGIGGLADPAAGSFGLEHRSADLGQTLGIYGFGDGFYIVWPLLGPSTLRDSLGMMGDSMISPLRHLMAADLRVGAAIYVGRTVNAESLRLGEYEGIIRAAVDPYLAIRNAYWQFRRNKILSRSRVLVSPTVFNENVDFEYN